uniref:Dolichyl-diphosphooligosaccharide--protein glycosyltransferase subunit 1 n=1 Tax=Meloidogyne enterolobii TaxID=390850 RepID=A0A6V7VSL9_MELEN|nr:unnamed protein product [Meloidogyne enterolobii]
MSFSKCPPVKTPENFGILIICLLICVFDTYLNAILNAQQTELTLFDGLKVVSATRNVDITSQIVKVKTEFELKNEGKEDVSFFVNVITEDEAKHLSWMVAFETGKETGKFRVSRAKVKGAPDGFIFHKLELLNLLSTGSAIKVTVEYALTEYLVPHPKEIIQSENQLVLYSGLANIPSAYSLLKETCIYKVGSVQPIAFTDVSLSKYASGKITYGPYENSKPYTKKPITIHCENNSPFLVATKVDRFIEISHWGGNLAVEENVEIVNKGAFLKGSFSRLDFQMDRRGMKQPVVRSFKSILPPATRDIYYRDEIGNISTSSVYPRNDRVEVELRPRFPLFGGWRTNYVLGYNIPSSSFLHSSGSNYALRMKMMDRLFDNAVVQKLRLKIILPEMSTNIKLVTPYSVKRLPDETYKTYLDTFGRPVVVIEKENLINNHIQTFTANYNDLYQKIKIYFFSFIMNLNVFI